MQTKPFVFQQLADKQAQRLADFEREGLSDDSEGAKLPGKSEIVEIRRSPWGAWLENQGLYRGQR